MIIKSLYKYFLNIFLCYIGNSGYPLRPWLLTPLEQEPAPGTPESQYNVFHKRTRCLIERCNGLLKMRFRCLLKHRVLHYTPQTATKIINACVILHNICIQNNVPVPEEEDEEVDFGVFLQGDAADGDEVMRRRVNPFLAQARQIQRRLINNYFNNML